MKPFQLFALLAGLVVVVFIATFASMYVGQPNKNQATTPEEEGSLGSLQLAFEEKEYPPQAIGTETFIPSEFNKTSHHDFWFFNANDEEVRVGLSEKTCACSDVALCLATEEWQERLSMKATLALGGASVATRMAPVAMDFLGSFSAVTGLVLSREERKLISGRTEPDRMRVLAVGDSDGVAVPPRTGGFIRLEWIGKKETQESVKQQTLGARLWTQNRKRGVGVSFQVRTVLLDPIHLDRREQSVGSIASGDEPPEVIFRCWSATRPKFQLKTNTDSDPYVSCRIEPFTQLEYNQLAAPFHLPLMCGYRVVVKIHEKPKSADQAWFDQGRFQRQIVLTPVVADKTLEPVEVYVTGIIKGDITVEPDGQIHLGSFFVSRGTEKTVRVKAERPNIDLKVDKKPDFMKVKLSKAALSDGNRPTWDLHIVIEENQVSKNFPDPRDERYQDTSIYLQILGENGRRVRVPVSGTPRIR